MTDKIAPIPKNETVNYGDRIVENFWKPKATTSFSQSSHKDAIINLLRNTQSGFVCVYSEKLEDKDIIKLLFDLSGKIRVYILVNDYSQELDSLNGKALIRYSGVQNKGSFILANPNSNVAKGVFFGGQLTEQSLLIEQFSFNLKVEEINELFRHFCYQFWEKAQMEITEKNSKKNVEPNPIDIYYDQEKFGGKDYVYGTLFDFYETTERGNLAGQRIVFLNSENQLPQEIKAVSDKQLPYNQMKQLLPKEEFEAQKPEFKDDGVSVQITYSWQNVPFYLPENAKRHNLYTQWENEKIKIDSKLRKLMTDIENLEKRGNTLSEKLSRFFLGKKNQFEDLKRQIAELQKVDFPNITKEERNEKVSSINKISSDISSHSREIDHENEKAHIDEEIEKLMQQVDAKKSELEKKEKERSEKESKRNALNDELKPISDELEKTDKEDKNTIEDLSRKENILKDQISELETFIKKDEDDKINFEKEINHLENEIKSKETEKQKIDSQEEKEESSLTAILSKKDKKHQNATTEKAFEIQNLPQLPQTGILFGLDRNYYLAIEYWEEYEKGKVEAQRLDAKLCAIK